jgi:UDP-glucuronate 4-epimerase
MKILVTGSAGFIGSALTLRLLERGDKVIGIDNHNNYYDPTIKEARLALLTKFSNYQHYRIDLSDKKSVDEVFKNHKFQRVVNFAAQAGVRYSMENPLVYINSNRGNGLSDCLSFYLTILYYIVMWVIRFFD